MHRRTDVVAHPAELGVGQGPGSAPGGGLRLDHAHRQTRPGTDHRGGQPVGAAAYDGDIDARIIPAHQPVIAAR